MVLASGFSQAGTFVAAVLVARFLGKSNLGAYAAAVSIGAIVVGGVGSGLPVLALRETAAGRVDLRYLQVLARIQAGVSIAASAPAALVGFLVIGGVRGAVFGLVAGLANVGMAMLSLAVAVSSGLHRYRMVAVVQAVSGAGFAFLTFLALDTGGGDTAALAALGVAGAIGAAALWLSIRGHLPADALSDPSRLLRRSAPFIGIGLSNSGFFRIDSVLILLASTASAAGLYASAYRVLGPFSLVASGFGIVLYARLSSLPSGTEWQRIRQMALRFYWLTILPLAALTFIFLPQIMVGLFGPSFRSGVTPARILLLSLIPKSLYWPNVYALTSSGGEGTVFRVFLVGLIFDSGLVIAFAQAWGATGASIAWVITECTVWAGITWSTRSWRHVVDEYVRPAAEESPVLGAEPCG